VDNSIHCPYKRVLTVYIIQLAREIATISYRSGPEWELRFGRKRAQENQSPALCPDFLIETYLDHQGERFCLQYDANSLLYVSKAMDMFDMSKSAVTKLSTQRTKNEPVLRRLTERQNGFDDHNEQKTFAEACRYETGNKSALEQHEETTTVAPKSDGKKVLSTLATSDPVTQDLIEGMTRIKMPALVLGVQSDILFPVWQQKEIAECLRAAGNKNVTYYELDSMYGHDTFLIDGVSVGGAVKGHLELLDTSK